MSDESKNIIDKDSAVSIGVIIGILAFVVVIVGWTNADTRWKATHEQSIKTLTEKLTKITDQLDSASADRWHRTDMVNWVMRLQEQNPDLSIPALPTPGIVP